MCQGMVLPFQLHSTYGAASQALRMIIPHERLIPLSSPHSARMPIWNLVPPLIMRVHFRS